MVKKSAAHRADREEIARPPSCQPAAFRSVAGAYGSCALAQKLLVWREAIRLVEIVYRNTGHFPREETFGLKMQLRRSAVSVPSNIAEGAARMTTGELLQFLGIARGSPAEIETQIELAGRLGFLGKPQECLDQPARAGKLLSALMVAAAKGCLILMQRVVFRQGGAALSCSGFRARRG